MAISTTACKRCEKPIETEHVAGEEPISPEKCNDCELIAKLTNTIAGLVKMLEDKLPSNPDAELQELVAQAKGIPEIAFQLDAIIDKIMNPTQPELDGVVPTLTTPEIRAQEYAAAQDQKSVVGERVKERERTLLSSMREADVQRVVITDATGLHRGYDRDVLEKIKTSRNPD